MADVKKSVEIAIKVTGLSDTQLKNFANSFTQLSKVIDSTKKSFDNFSANVKKIRPALEGLSAGTKKVKTSLNEMGNEATNAGFKVKTFGDKVKTVAQFRGISAALLALTGTFQAGASAIFEYDQALKDLQAITASTEFEVAQMGDKILEVAATTKFSASEVAAGMRTIGQAGFNATEAVDTMQAVSDLATGTLSDMSTTVDLVTTAMRVFGIEATRSSEIADVFANAVNRSKLTVDKLRTAMNYIGPIAKAAGVSFKELSASMGVLANSGLRASTIGTGLRRVFAELVDPSKKLQEAARRAGVALSELDPTTTSLSEVISNLHLVVNDAQIAFDIFGKRGAAAVLALSSSQGTFDNMLRSISKTGTASEQAAIQMEGLGVSFKNLKDRMGVLAIAVGELGITDAFRILIDVLKVFANALLFLVTNPITKFIIKMAALPVIILAVAKALALLKATQLFATAIPAVVGFTTALQGATLSATALRVALGPILLILTGLILGAKAFYDSFVDGATEASNSASLLAQEYGKLSEKIDQYRIATLSLKAGSEALLTESDKLKDYLTEAALGTSKFAEEAAAAASKINPLTGELSDQGEALENLQTKINELSFRNLSVAVEEAGKALDKQTSFIIRKLNNVYDVLKAAYKLPFTGIDATKEIADDIDRVEELSQKLKDQQLVYKDLIEWRKEYGKTTTSTQGKALAKDIDFLNEKMGKFIEIAIEAGKVSLDGTTESFKNAGEALNLTGLELDAFIGKMEILAKVNEGSFSNIIEKWSQNKDPKFLSNVVDAFNEIDGLQEMISKEEIKRFEAEQENAVFRLNRLKDEYKEEVAKYGESKALVERYLDSEQLLIQKADETKRKMAESVSAQKAIAYATELQEVQKQLDIINIKHADSLYKREEAKRKILADSNKRIQAIATESSVDPKQELADYKITLEERELAHQKHLNQIEAQEHGGVITKEQAEANKRTSTEQYYADIWELAKKYYAKVENVDDPKAVRKAKKELLDAETAYYKEREKLLAYDNKLVKKRKEQAKKIEKVEFDLAKKIESINKNLAKKLEKIERDRVKVKKSIAADIIAVEDDSEDKIKDIKARGLTDEQKEVQKAIDAAQKLSKARAIIAQADKEKDLEKLKVGQDLLDQASDMFASLENEASAIGGVRTAALALKKALQLEGHLKDLDLVEKKNKAIEDAANKRAKAETEADVTKAKLKAEFGDAVLYIEKAKKTQLEAVTSIFTERTRLEELRHLKEMKNLELELNKLKEKQRVSIESQLSYIDTSVDSSARSEAALIIASEQAIHNEKMANYDAQIAKIEEKIKAENTVHKKLEIANKASFSVALQQVDEISRKGFRMIEENGIKTFTDLTDAQIRMTKDITQAALDGTGATVDEMGNKIQGAFTKIYDEHGKLVRILGEGIDVEVGEVEVPDIKEDIEKNLTKIDPVEIPVAVDDVDDTLDLLIHPDEIQPIAIEVEVRDQSEVQTLTDNLDEERLPREIDSSIEISGLQQALNGVLSLVDAIADLKDKTITITQNIVTKGGTTTYAAKGAILSGYGGGDRRPAMLEDGEGIIRKEGVRMVGANFIHALNNLRIPKFSLGGIMGGVTSAAGALKSSTNALKDFGKVTLNSGNMEIPALVHRDTFTEVTDKLNKLKRFAT